MRVYPDDNDDWGDFLEMNAPYWMLNFLKLNPEYPHWGPHEDYMAVEGAGWQSRQLISNWKLFNLHLDELNEVVNFYFFIHRPSIKCPDCENGYNRATQEIEDNFYANFDETRCWCDKLTQEEVDLLYENRRIHTKQSAADFNKQIRERKSLGHDSFNRWLLVEHRAKKAGVYGSCLTCKGKAHLYTSKIASLGLTLWIIHPRKGCSRGFEISQIDEEDLPQVLEFLKLANERNNSRFKKAVEFDIKSYKIPPIPREQIDSILIDLETTKRSNDDN